MKPLKFATHLISKDGDVLPPSAYDKPMKKLECRHILVIDEISTSDMAKEAVAESLAIPPIVLADYDYRSAEERISAYLAAQAIIERPYYPPFAFVENVPEEQLLDRSQIEMAKDGMLRIAARAVIGPADYDRIHKARLKRERKARAKRLQQQRTEWGKTKALCAHLALAAVAEKYKFIGADFGPARDVVNAFFWPTMPSEGYPAISVAKGRKRGTLPVSLSKHIQHLQFREPGCDNNQTKKDNTP